MRLADWPWLLALVIIPLLHRWWRARNRPASVLFPVSVPAGVAGKDPLLWLLALRYVGLAFVTLALARPQASFRQTERTVSGVDIVMVLDISASMNIEDLNDRPRHEIAKQTMAEFVRGRESDRIGFVVFSGEPLTLAPPTLDYGLVLKAIKDIEIGSLKDGTAIGDGLSIGIKHLRNSKAKSRVIVLLTDGDNNVGQVDPGTAGDMAAGFGIKVYSIAIGREGRVKMPIRQKGPFGRVITTYQWFDNALNPELLQAISKETNGKFYRVTEPDALTRVFREIDELEKTDVKSKEKVRYEERFQIPLEAGLLALAAERALAWGWWRFIP